MEGQNEYLLKMFNEFKRVYGLDDTWRNFWYYRDRFIRWVVERQCTASKYVQLYDYLKSLETYRSGEESRLMAEFGKGVYDTAAIAMAQEGHTPIVVSPYANTIRSSLVQTYDGELASLLHQGVVIKYSTPREDRENPNISGYNDDIGILMLQLPCTTKEIDALMGLAESDRTLFVGAYGKLKDKDREEKLARLREIHAQLVDLSHRDIQYCQESVNDDYVAALRMCPNEKVLSLHNSLHR